MNVPLGYEIRTSHLRLRRMTVADVPRLHDIQSNWNVTRMLRMAPFPPTLDGLHRWLSGHDTEWRSGSAYRFAIVVEGQVTGCADIDGVASGSCELGYWLDEAYWGRGLASEAAGAVLTFALREVQLNRVLSGHAADNPASGRILRKPGFRWTGDVSSWSLSRREHIIQRKYEFVDRR